MKLYFFMNFISRSSERGNLYFTLQRRRGQDEERSGLAGLLVATWDSVTESNVTKIKSLNAIL